MIRLYLMLFALVTSATPIISVAADGAVTAEDIFKIIKPDLKAELLAGEIVTITRPKLETDDAGLAIGLAVMVPVKLDKALATLKTLNVSDDPGQRRVTHEIVGKVKRNGKSKVFDGLKFDKDEGSEVKKMLRAKAGDDFNFSTKELGWFRKAATEKNQAQAAAKVMRRVLANRYLAYQKKGLKELPPYARGGKKVTYPGKQLAATTEAMPLLRQRMPNFYQAFRHYPGSGASNYKHRFFWEKKRVDDQPMFSLRHEMVKIDSKGAVLANREYYISTQLNTYQVAIVLIPYGSQTIVALANQTYTDMVKGRKRFMAVHIGRSAVESKTKPLFEKLRKKLGRAKPVATR